MKEERLRLLLARVMIWGLALSVVVMFIGGIYFLSEHASQKPGDHKFTGEPADLRHPLDIIQTALEGNDDCLIQLGVLLLLFNPMVRVALAAWGYMVAKDSLYTSIAGLVLAILVISYFV